MAELGAAVGLAMVIVPFVVFTGVFSHALWTAGIRGDGPVDTLASAGSVVLASMCTVGLIHLPPVWAFAEAVLGV